MDTITTIASIVAALFGILAFISSERNSKRHIYKRIDRLEQKVHDIDRTLDCTYGFRRARNVITPLDEKKEQYLSEIDHLKRLL